MKPELYTCRGTYTSSDPVILSLDQVEEDEIGLVNLFHLQECVKSLKWDLHSGNNELNLGFFHDHFQCYGVQVILKDKVLSTSFEICNQEEKTVRYGFLSEFNSYNPDCIRWLAKFHINAIQFYDWSFRHDHLVSDDDEYEDMMGKHIKKNVLNDLISQCHSSGIKAIAYGAIYAASEDYYHSHPDEAMLNSLLQPFVFIGKFYLMDISRDGEYRKHIIHEYQSAISQMHFDGIHMDTYGFPKTAYVQRENGKRLIYLKEEIPSLINETRNALGPSQQVSLIFNNVGNWPVLETAKCDQNAVYVEVWPPYEQYSHLQQIVREIRSVSEKPIVLAAYLKPFREDNPICAMYASLYLSAACMVLGATCLLLGDDHGILTQGYYSDHSILTDLQEMMLRSYSDFMIRYEEILFDHTMDDVSFTHTCWDNYEYRCVSHPVTPYGEPDKIWMILKENKKRKCIFLINLIGNQDPYWNQGKSEPVPQNNIVFRIQVDTLPVNIWCASPEEPDALPVTYSEETDQHGLFVTFTISKLNLLKIIWINSNEKDH
ncbi:MAG: glycoside hydrolase family 66 protein [Stecheria intestinalis]|nr:glycoside hydrolase family 66 protein [Stecheria intestinalis]MDY4681181.1 glycoside hydrolase family 66 protein [Lachnospiraceae bacterium]